MARSRKGRAERCLPAAWAAGQIPARVAAGVLALLEATLGSIRRTVAAWFAALTLVGIRMSGVIFGPERWEQVLQHRFVPIAIGGAALLAILFQLARGDDRRNMVPWAVVVVIDLILLPGGNQLSQAVIVWFWQIVLVVPGLLLAAQPLRTMVQSVGASEPTAPGDPLGRATANPLGVHSPSA